MWGNEQQSAFEEAKRHLCSPSVLAHYDPEKPLILSADASPYGIGAVLSHQIDGEEKPIAFVSRTLTSSEKRYSQLDREGLAIVYAVKYFHQYLYGRSFTIISDHKPLKHIFSTDKCVSQMVSARTQRWALTLSAYNYQIQFKPGKDIAHADMLSRLPLSTVPQKVPLPGEIVLLLDTLQNSPITVSTVQKWTDRDPILSRVRDIVLKGWVGDTTDPELQPYNQKQLELSVQDGLVLWGSRVVVPSAGRESMLELLHEGHSEMCRMKQLARSYVWWPTMQEDIQKKVRESTRMSDLSNPSEVTTFFSSSPLGVASETLDEDTHRLCRASPQ